MINLKKKKTHKVIKLKKKVLMEVFCTSRNLKGRIFIGDDRCLYEK